MGVRHSNGITRIKRLVVVAAFLTGLGAPVAAYADGAYTNTPAPNVGSSDPGVAPAVVHTQSAGTFSLPLTGADIAEMSVIGAGAVVAGTVLVRRARRTD
ncbi:MAG: hypothetical protein M3159_03425 [Actinomycetota bacterium]|nr:hypothetical protein [Actinomycetota bacterium]